MSGARTESPSSIVRLAPSRVTSVPLGIPSSATGSSCTASTTVMRAGDPVVTSTNQGSARNVICVPSDETTSAARSGASPRRRRSIDAVTSDQPASVLLHRLAVELEPAAGAQVLDDVPVHGAHIRAAEEREAVADGDVGGAVDLLVVGDVLHVARDPGVAADAELADAPRALVGVERGEQEVLVALGRGVDDAPALEAEANARHLAPEVEAGELGEVDRPLGAVLDRAEEEVLERAQAQLGVLRDRRRRVVAADPGQRPVEEPLGGRPVRLLDQLH